MVVRSASGRVLNQVLIVEAEHELGAGNGSNLQARALARYAEDVVKGLDCPVLCKTDYPALLLEATDNCLRCEASHMSVFPSALLRLGVLVM